MEEQNIGFPRMVVMLIEKQLLIAAKMDNPVGLSSCGFGLNNSKNWQ